jgi:hypothetical protein
MVYHTIQYLSEWEPLERSPPLKEHSDWLWDSITIEQNYGLEPWQSLAQEFTKTSRSKTALSSEYVLQARRMEKVRDTTPYPRSTTLTFS